jgi:hypothetical protein
LDLCDDQAGSKGVDGTRWDKDAVADLRAEHVQALFCLSRRDGVFEVGTANPWLETSVKNRVRFGLDHVPSLCFSPIWLRHLSPISVVRVDLDAQNPLAVQILQEEWKSFVGGIFPKNFDGEVLDQFSKCPALERTGIDNRLPFAVIHNLPAFGPNAVIGKFFS